VSEDERYLENLRGALAQSIGIGERLQARIDAALELLRRAKNDPVIVAAIDALEGRTDAG
jgi:hypothetical protein